MATVELTAENFESVIGGADLALVNFWAAWCGPCRMFGPIFEQASEEYPDAVFGKVDTEAQQELAASFGISSIPTLMIIRDNVVLYAQPGALPAAALDRAHHQGPRARHGRGPRQHRRARRRPAGRQRLTRPARGERPRSAP